MPPQYGYAFDRAQGALLNFEDSDASTTMLDDFGNTWTAVANAQIDTAQSKFGSSSLLLDCTGDYLESTNYTTHGDGSWERSCWVRWSSLPTAGNRQGAAEDHAQHVVEVVRDAAGEPAHGFHALRLPELQRPGGKRLPAAAFLAGHPVATAGAAFDTSAD